MRLCTAGLLLLAFLAASAAGAQESPGTGPDFGLGITIGATSFPNPAYPADPDADRTITYQTLGLTPEFALGKFGMGLDLTLNYTFTGGDGSEFELRREDWIPPEGMTILELYLPKIRYLRWAQKGDPLYVLLGSVDHGVLGNGFIMGGYTNTQFLPERRLFGLSLDVDGALFGFPYVGVESFAANLALFDLIGGRLFVRPLIGTGVPILRNLQLGTTVVADRKPFHYARQEGAIVSDYLPPGLTADEASVVIWGADVRQPILATPVISLAAFGDYVNQNRHSGGMVGAGGRLFGVVTYGGQIRFLGENFIPVYFDKTYDLYRPLKYAVYSGAPGFGTDPYVGWFATAGFSLLDDRLVFGTEVSGPFGGAESDETFKLPHLRASFMLAEGLVGGFSLQATYDKRGIESLADLVDPENSVIGARVNYRIESATISLVYDLRYDPFPAPGDSPWIVTSRIESAITLF